MPLSNPDVHEDAHSSERGLSLVELLVALLVLGVSMAGVASLTISTLQVTNVNDARSVATNLAQAEIERLRALPFADLVVGGRVTREVEADGVVFDVVRDTTWADLDADTDPCAEPEGSVDTALVRVDVEVARRDLDTQPVRSTTTIARPPVAPATDVGALSVKVLDEQDPPVGVASVRVRVVGPLPGSGEVRLQVTPSTGCVLFTDLPPGTYDVDLQRAGYVSMASDPEPTRTVGIAVASRSALEIGYARAGGLLLDASSRPDGPVGALPTELPITLSRDELLSTTARGQELAPLWPGRLELWGGDCPTADPLGGDDAPFWPGAVRQARLAVPAGSTGAAVAELAVVRVDVPTEVSDVTAPQPVLVTATNLDACPDGTPTLAYGSLVPGTDTPGSLDLAVPYGRWALTATNDAGIGVTRYAAVDPRSTGLVASQDTPPTSGDGDLGGADGGGGS